MFVSFGLGGAGDEVEAEEFVGIGEIISSQEDRGIGLGSVYRKNCTLPDDSIHTRPQTVPLHLHYLVQSIRICLEPKFQARYKSEHC